MAASINLGIFASPYLCDSSEEDNFCDFFHVQENVPEGV